MLPHNPCKYAGMIGASVPSTILSIPRLKPCICPVRVSDPSGKMQTTSPRCTASFAARSDSMIARGPAVALIGITPMIFASQLSERFSA